MYYFEPIEGARYRQDYQKLEWELQQAKDSGDGQKALEIIRQQSRDDLFFLIFFVLGIHAINAPWLVDRINEVENDRNMSATFWPREHFKTTIKTYAQTIQDLLRNPEARIGLFSHTRDISKSILRRIMYTLERNMMLKLSFPDILYMKPRTTPGVKFSEDEGVIVQRRGEYNESTIEAWGLVDGMPTSKHFTIMKLDDLETEKAVSTPEQIRKLKDAFALAFNLSERRGIIEIIGTIYDFGSLHYDIKNSPDWKVSCWGAEESAFLTPEELEKKRRLMGDWVYACHAGESEVLLPNWTTRRIKDIREGDMVVGMTGGRLIPSRVLKTQVRPGRLVEYTLDHGKVRCTPDHKWYTGRTGSDAHRMYAPLGSGYHDLDGLVPVLTSAPEMPEELSRDAAWLGGIFDGEGSVGESVFIHQSESHNPEVCEAIRKTARRLGFDFGESISERPGHGRAIHFNLRGGKSERLRFAKWCSPVRAGLIYSTLMTGHNGSCKTRYKLVGVTDMGDGDVYNIQTETGNYIAGGYVSKNCQMENNPIQLDERRMSVDWLKYHRGGVDIGRNRYIVVDPARTKGNDSDFTVMWVFEIDSRKNYIFLDVVRDKMSLSERWEKLRGLVEKWNNVIRVGYAKTAFEQDIEYIRERQSRDGVFFSIIPITETKQKLRRMETLQPLFKDGRIILPQNKIYQTLEGKQLDLIEIFVKDEYLAFPSMAHDDMLDAMAMCRHEEMGANASRVEEPTVAIKIHPILIRERPRGRLQWMVR